MPMCVRGTELFAVARADLILAAMPTGRLRTVAQPPNELLDGDRRQYDPDDGAPDEHPSDIAVMFTA